MDTDILMDKRTYFIGDRVAFSQILFLVLTGTITSLIEMVNLVDFFIISLWWLFLLILPLTLIIIIAAAKIKLYFFTHWATSFLLFFGIWFSFTVYLGLLVDSAVGYGNTLWVSMFVAGIYFGGYIIAKIFRYIRHSFETGTLIGLGFLISCGVIAITLISGIQIYNLGLNDIFAPTDYFLISANQTSRIGIYLIITGFGIVISMGIHLIMFYCLHDPAGLDIEENPPNELYVRIMIVSFILTFISWILLLVLFPPIAGGGKKKGKFKAPKIGRSRYPRTYYSTSRYATYSSYGDPSIELTEEEIIDKEWAEHGLDRESRERDNI